MNGKKCKRTRKLDRSLVCIAFRFGKDGESWEGGFNAKYQRRTKTVVFFLTRKELRFYQVEGESFFVVL